MRKALNNYRLKITDGLGNATYFVRRDDRTFYMGGDETPLALSNLIGSDAASTRFALEDARTDGHAAKALRDVLARRWQNNRAYMPKVEIIN